LFSGAPSLDLPTVSSLGPVPADGPTFAEAFATLWPRAIAGALDAFAAAVRSGRDPLRHSQFDLAVARIWRDLAAELGPPELVASPTPRPLPVAVIDPGGPDPTGDGYAGSAEFFDLAAREHTRRSAPAAVAALARIDPSAGPLLDIGAGTGLVTVAVARAFPDLQVIAAEPSPPMRAILTSRVADDPALRAQVTVVDGDADTVAIPGTLSGVLLCGVLGHLDRDRRVALFRRLATALAPGAPVVVELMGMRTAEPMPDTRLFDTTLGSARYEWWMSGEPVGLDLMRLHTTWRVHQDGQLRREVRDSYLWHPFGVEELADETGFALEPLPPPHGRSAPHMAVLRAPSPGDRDALRAEGDTVLAEADLLP
jgi:precorrin-6B methylase 2